MARRPALDDRAFQFDYPWRLAVRFQKRIHEGHRRFQLRSPSHRCLSFYRNRTEHRLTHMRRCIPNFLAIPRIVPSPCSYSRRICSNSSTLALLSTRPPLGRLSPKRSTRYMAFSKGGPNQSIEWGQIRVSKSPRASCRGSAASWPFVDDVCCRLRMDCISDGRDALASIDSRRSTANSGSCMSRSYLLSG
jgi:hypothetical protein